jgi:hypothetical protein
MATSNLAIALWACNLFNLQFCEVVAMIFSGGYACPEGSVFLMDRTATLVGINLFNGVAVAGCFSVVAESFFRVAYPHGRVLVVATSGLERTC